MTPRIKFAGFVSVAVCSLLFVTYVLSADKQATVLTAPVEHRELRVRVHSVGELDALRSTVISSQLTGNDAKIVWLIDEGTRVATGDVLIQLDSKPFEQAVEKYKDLVRELEVKLDAEGQLLAFEKNQVEQDIESKEYELKTARIDLNKLEKGDGPLEMDRLQSDALKAETRFRNFSQYLGELEAMLAKGGLKEDDILDVRKQLEEAAQEYKTAKTKYDNFKTYVYPSEVEKAKANVAKCQLSLEQAKKGGGFRIGKAIASQKMAKSELENARFKLTRALEELEGTAIKAPLPGMVVLKEAYRDGENRKPRIGDSVMGNQPLVYLPDVSRMVVKTQVREIDLHKVSQGKKAVVRVDAYPHLTLSGEVTGIGVLGKIQDGAKGREKYFTVEVLLNAEENQLRPGMTARVEIAASDVNGLTVPVQSVFQEEDGPHCYVQQGAGFQRQSVALGSGNEHFQEIVSGLTEGDRVALIRPAASIVKDGALRVGHNG